MLVSHRYELSKRADRYAVSTQRATYGKGASTEHNKMHTWDRCSFCSSRQTSQSQQQELVTEATSDKRSVRTIMTTLRLAWSIYAEMTGTPITQDVRDECTAMATLMGTKTVRTKQVATPSDLESLITEGVFGDDLKFRCPRERSQAALLPLLITYTACRPGEMVLGPDQTSALRWRDVKFFICLADPDDLASQLILTADVTNTNMKGHRGDPLHL